MHVIHKQMINALQSSQVAERLTDLQIRRIEFLRITKGSICLVVYDGPQGPIVLIPEDVYA